MKAVNIKWDTDGDTSLEATLPTEMNIPDNIAEERVADYLSDETGFCLFGYNLVS